MRIASFFSGIGGLELGLERALGGEVVFQCERDPYAVSILERHWPGVPRSDDITTLEAADIPPADLYCGGFPCTDISIAGKGAGLDGDQSGLWFEWLRLIRMARPRPRWVVVENVSAILGRGLGVVLGQLSELGYDAEWSVLSARDVGAPHRRARLFLIGWQRDVPDADRLDKGGRLEPERLEDRRDADDSGHGPERSVAGCRDVADTEGERERPGHRSRRDGGRHELVESPRPGGDADHRGEASQPCDVADAQGERERPGLREGEPGWVGGRRPGHQGGTGAPQDVADAEGERQRAEREGRAAAHGEGCGDTEGRAGADIGAARPRSERPVGDTVLEGSQKPEQRHLASEAQRGQQARPAAAQSDRGAAQRGLGRAVDGLPAWLDPTAWLDGTWERGTPRVVSGQASRAARLRCLGNAVVPACGFVVGVRLAAIRAELEAGAAS